MALSGGPSQAEAQRRLHGAGYVPYFASIPPPLPVVFDYTLTHDGAERWLFSRWGEAVTVQSPSTGLTA